MIPTGAPSIVALAMTEARSSVGWARRSSVSCEKYTKKSLTTAIRSSIDCPRDSSSSDDPNSSWVSCSMRG